jgi:exo-1,4-beta-D-glucosaminidase
MNERFGKPASGSKGTLAINQCLLTTTKHGSDLDNTYFVHTPTRKRQNLRQINDLPDAKLVSDLKCVPVGGKMDLTMEVENPSEDLALSIELMLLDAGTGRFVAPVYLDDNYFSLLPGERRTIRGYCHLADLDSTSLKLKVSGVNIK